jgi:hypothetical protein
MKSFGACLGACLCVVLLARTAQAATLNVDDDNQTGTEDGSAAHPYATVQAAVDKAAKSGDTIQVAAGTYGAGAGTKVNGKELKLLGGFVGGSTAAYAAGTPGDFSTETRSPTANPTKLTGIATASSPVAEGALLLLYTKKTVVDGFVIFGSSRGVFTYGETAAESSPTLSNNLIEDNGNLDTDYGQGGGLWAQKGAITLTGNTIRGNHASKGAGVASFADTFVGTNNVIENNTGHADHAGGLYLGGSSVTFSHNLIKGNVCCASTDNGKPGYGWGGGALIFQNGNSAPGATKAYLSYNTWTDNGGGSSGSAIFVDDKAEAHFDHELVYKNRCNAHGQVIYVDGYDDGSTVFISNSTIVDNAGKCTPPSNEPGGILLERNSHVSIANSIFWGNAGAVGGKDFAFDDTANTVTVTYSITEEQATGAGNLAKDPLFADAAAGDYHLKSKAGRYSDGQWIMDGVDSPAIDAADPSAPFDLEPGPNGGRANLGHLGNSCEASMGGPGGEPPVAGECEDAPLPMWGDAGPGGGGGSDGGGGGGGSDGGENVGADGSGGCGCRASARGKSTLPARALGAWILLGGLGIVRRRRRRGDRTRE